jgi:hypothetical protein
MKLLSRMMAFLSFLVMFQYANAASNNIYVDQIGDGSTISITQTGSGNQLGSTNNRATLNGNNNNITVQQIGNSNVTNLNVQGDGATVSSIINGNSNQSTIDCSGCTGATISKTITGNGNEVSITNDGMADTVVNVTSDNNTVTLTNNSTATAGVVNRIDISGGNGNQVVADQTGAASTTGHSLDLTITGAMNTATIKQGGTVDSKVNTTITGSSNTLTVKSNHN